MQFDTNLIHQNQTNYLECEQQSYCSLMELYENNYRLIKKIMRTESELLIQGDNGQQFFLQLVERTKYTSQIRLHIKQTKKQKNNLTHWMTWLQQGKITIRVYHDARAAEADLCEKNRSTHQNLKYLWFLNATLNNWLVSINKVIHKNPLKNQQLSL